MRRALLAVLLLAFVLRMGWVLAERAAYVSTQTDPQGAMAHSLVHGHGFLVDERLAKALGNEQRQLAPADVHLSGPPHYVNEPLFLPGPAVVLSVFWRVTAESYLPVQLLGVLLDTVNVWLLYLIGKRLIGERGGLIAAALYAVCPLAIVFASTALEPVWVIAAVLLSILVVLRRLDDSLSVVGTTFVLGAIVGAGAYFRSNTFLLPVAAALALAVHARWREAVTIGVGALVLGYALFSPWVFRQHSATGAWLPLGRTGTGQVLWQGLGEVPNSVGALKGDLPTYQQVHAMRPDLVFGSPAYDDYLGARFRSAPRSLLLKAAVHRAPRLAFFPVVRFFSGGLHRVFVLAQLVYGVVVFALAVIGLWLIRRDWQRWSPVLAVGALWWLAQLPFLANGRFTFPGLVPLYVLLAARLTQRRPGAV